MKRTSLSETHPQLAAEWDYIKNAPLTPQLSSKGQTKKVWWKCPKGHSYAARIDHRCSMHSGCPYCANKAVLVGENDLSTVHPEIAAEWDYSKNEKRPEEYLPYSNKLVFWICPLCKQSYKKSIYSRTNMGSGCPICTSERHTSRQEQIIFYYLSKVTQAENRAILYGQELDIYLPSLHIGIEYNGEYYHQNKQFHDLKKRQILKSYGINVIVISCARERNVSKHEIMLKSNPMANPHDTELIWGLNKLFNQLNLTPPEMDLRKDMVSIYSQYIKSIKNNSVALRFPELAKEWDCEKNKGLVPEAFSFGSNKKVWWKCSACKSSYDMSIVNRTIGKSACPYCAGKRIKVGFNDLATTHPHLAKEWDYEKNVKTPQEYTQGSDFKANWTCSICAHRWAAPISSRSQGVGCPLCASKVIIAGQNDFATLNPTAAKLWNYTKNAPYHPEEYALHSNKRFWWYCDICGHEWQANINSIVRGRRCPECAKKKRAITRKETYLKKNGSLADLYPALLQEWDFEKNDTVSPFDTTAGTHLKAHWICHICGYRWHAAVYSRAAGSGCPKCAGKIKK